MQIEARHQSITLYLRIRCEDDFPLQFKAFGHRLISLNQHGGRLLYLCVAGRQFFVHADRPLLSETEQDSERRRSTTPS